MLGSSQKPLGEPRIPFHVGFLAKTRRSIDIWIPGRSEKCFLRNVHSKSFFFIVYAPVPDSRKTISNSRRNKAIDEDDEQTTAVMPLCPLMRHKLCTLITSHTKRGFAYHAHIKRAPIQGRGSSAVGNFSFFQTACVRSSHAAYGTRAGDNGRERISVLIFAENTHTKKFL